MQPFTMKQMHTEVMFPNVFPVLYLHSEFFGGLLLCAGRGMLWRSDSWYILHVLIISLHKPCWRAGTCGEWTELEPVEMFEDSKVLCETWKDGKLSVHFLILTRRGSGSTIMRNNHSYDSFQLAESTAQLIVQFYTPQI